MSTKLVSRTMMAMLFLCTLLIETKNTTTSQFQPFVGQTKMAVFPTENRFFANVTPPGSIFVINITVMDVADLWNWQMCLTWDPALLNFSRIWLPLDHVFSQSGKTIVTPPPLVELGCVMWACTYVNGDPNTPEYWTFNGTGTLCQIEFVILNPESPGPASCDLILARQYADTFLLDGQCHDIQFEVENGWYIYNGYLLVDLAPSGIVLASFKETITFVVNASEGVLPYRIQWFFRCPNGTELEVTDAENQTSWTCYPITLRGDYRVKVLVKDSAGVKISASAIVRIRPSEIKSVNWKPTCPYPYVPSNITRASEPVLISVNVSEFPNIDQVLLSYRAYNDEWQTYSYTTLVYNATCDLWTTLLPGQLGNSTVEFNITVFIYDGSRLASSVYSFHVKPLPIGDINGDGIVNMRDIGIACNNFGKTEP